MAKLIAAHTSIPAAGQPPKIIEEFIGEVNAQTSALSIAKMTSAAGWREAGQTPEFDEYTNVLSGKLQVETRSAVHRVTAGQAIIVNAGEGFTTVRRVWKARSISRPAYPRLHL